jgi:hypothetical protein
MSQSINDNTRFTFMDVLRRECKDGALLLGNALAQTNDILEDLLLIKGNEKMGNRISKYTNLGQATRRRANQGVSASKSGVDQQYDACSIWADRIVIDELVAQSAADEALMIQQEIEAKRENLNIQMANDLFYGNPASALDSMLGIQPRLNTSSIPTVILAGGSSALTSAYLITHELNSFVAFYPESHPGGIKYVNRGPNQPITDASGKVFYGEVHDLEWAMGISLKNERRCARVANIASGSLSNTGSSSGGSGPDLLDLLLKGQNSVQNIKDSGKVWYVNRTVLSFITRQFFFKPNHFITRQDLEESDEPIWRINGVRIKLVEQISNAETAVS